MTNEIEQRWREKWLRIEERPLALADLTCECGYVPDWLEMVGGGEPPLAHARGIKLERQQDQLFFHLKATGHKLKGADMNEYSKVRAADRRAKLIVRAMQAAATIVAREGNLGEAMQDYRRYRDALAEIIDLHELLKADVGHVPGDSSGYGKKGL